MRSSAINAYQKAQVSALSSRQIEKITFERAVTELRAAADNVSDYQSYASALKFNQTLWTYIQASLCDKAVQIPEDIKATILSLSLFVDVQTIKSLALPNSDYLTPLIEINLNILYGLFPPTDSKPAVSSIADHTLYRIHPIKA